MAVNLREKEAAEILTVDGAQVFIGQAGVKKPDHNDLTLIVLNKANSVGAVFTQNRFCAAPVHIAKQHLTNENGIRALVINTGNANAGTGAQGREDALAVCEAVAAQVGCDIEQVLPFSTGVILEPLPAQKIIRALPGVKAAHWSDAARAIMTTDTVPKAASREAKIGQNHTGRATGIAKGAGMIHPKVLEGCGIDTDVYSGWAFGMGLERLAMRRFKISDLRLIFENDVRFLQQF